MENTEKTTTLSAKMLDVIQHQQETNEMISRRFEEMRKLLLIIKDKLGISDPRKERPVPSVEKQDSALQIPLPTQVSAIHTNSRLLANTLANEIDIAMRELSVISEAIS